MEADKVGGGVVVEAAIEKLLPHHGLTVCNGTLHLGDV
jgi:hypothetical protein